MLPAASRKTPRAWPGTTEIASCLWETPWGPPPFTCSIRRQARVSQPWECAPARVRPCRRWFRGLTERVASWDESQVLCSGTGTGTNSTAPVLLGTCTIPAGLLKPGDRVEIRFDYSHEGAATAPEFLATWGTTTLISRTGNASDTALAGRASAGIHAAGTQWSVESWGGTLSFAATAGTASDSPAAPLTIGCDERDRDAATLHGGPAARTVEPLVRCTSPLPICALGHFPHSGILRRLGYFTHLESACKLLQQ